MEISEKVAYLKGLAEGLNLDTESKEGKLIAAIIDVLDDMAEKIGNYSSSSSSFSSSLTRSLRSNSSFAPQLGQMTSPSSSTDSSK